MQMHARTIKITLCTDLGVALAVPAPATLALVAPAAPRTLWHLLHPIELALLHLVQYLHLLPSLWHVYLVFIPHLLALNVNGEPLETVGSNGERQVTGGAQLKETQTYPGPFGNAVAAICCAHREELKARWYRLEEQESQEITFDELMAGGDDWSDANLGPVFKILMQIIDAHT